MKLKISDIIIEDRKRQADMQKVISLADSMKEIGQLHAIKVNTEMKLRAGLHRIEAAKILGWVEIEADIIELDPLRQELVEIDENLFRSELHFLERGEFLRRRKEIYEILYPDARRGGDKKSPEFKEKKEKSEIKPGFARNTADKMGVTARSIHQDIQIAEKLAPEAKQIVRDANLPKADILYLIRTHHAPKEQLELVKKVQDGQAQTIHEAEKQLSKEKTIERGRATEIKLDADIKLGNSDDLFPNIADESIKMVLSSIRVEEINISHLMAESNRVLTQGGILALAMPQSDIAKLCCVPKPEGLKFLWLVADTLTVAEHDHRPEGMRSSWLPVAVFVKGNWIPRNTSDIIQKGIDSLRKNEDSLIQLVTRFSDIGDIILDPSTTMKFESYLSAGAGRKFIGFVKDEATLNFAKARMEEIAKVLATT